jgi:hypothetical protein
MFINLAFAVEYNTPSGVWNLRGTKSVCGRFGRPKEEV